MVRIDLLQPATTLAREMSRWTKACDKKVFRFICYTNSSLNLNVASHRGDSILVCKFLLFTDSDFSGDASWPKHICADCRRIVEYALRAEGSPIMDFWGSVLPFCSPCGRAGSHRAGGDSKGCRAGGDSQGNGSCDKEPMPTRWSSPSSKTTRQRSILS